MSSGLTRFGFQLAVNTHFDGVGIQYLVDQVTGQLEVDDCGCIKPHVLRNIKSVLKVAIQKVPDDLVASRCQAMLDFLNQYLEEEVEDV